MVKDKANAQTLTLRDEDHHFRDVKTDVSARHVYHFLLGSKIQKTVRYCISHTLIIAKIAAVVKIIFSVRLETAPTYWNA